MKVIERNGCELTIESYVHGHKENWHELIEDENLSEKIRYLDYEIKLTWIWNTITEKGTLIKAEA